MKKDRLSKISNHEEVKKLIKNFEKQMKKKTIKSKKDLIEDAHLCLDAAEFLFDYIIKAVSHKK